MMWKTRKSTTTEDETKATTAENAVEKEETTTPAEVADSEVTAKTSFTMPNLWKGRSSGGGFFAKKDEAENTIKNSEEKQEEQEATETTSEEDVVSKTTSRWMRLWGSTSTTDITSSSRLWLSSASTRTTTSTDSTSNLAEVEVEVEIDGSVRPTPGFAYHLGPSKDRPSLLDESLEMLTGSLMIYIFADLREMARNGKIDCPDLLEEPITVKQVITAIAENKQAIIDQSIDHEDCEQKLGNLKKKFGIKLQQKLEQQSSDEVRIEEVLQGGSAAMASAAALSQTQESVLAHFRDEKSTQGVVYGIAVNHVKKRITIIFRGSVTQQDFLTDARSSQKKIDNPLAAEFIPSDEKTISDIQIHSGFHSYLFRKDKDGKVRLVHIFDDVKQLLQENPGYRIYCTGHSLGGACATLCGYYAAADNELVQNGPVVVISIASPQVGNHAFVDSFHQLEKLNRVQHLRIGNREDMITHLPFIHVKAMAFSPLYCAVFGAGNLYKHCGIHLELKSIEVNEERKDNGDEIVDSKHYRICHPKGTCVDESYAEEFKRAVESAKLLAESIRPVAQRDFDALTKRHSCKEYEARLIAAESYLSTITLDQMYGDESIVGASFRNNKGGDIASG